MSQRVYGFALVATLLGVGANLAGSAVAGGSGVPPLPFAVALATTLLGVVTLAAGMLRRVIGNNGLVPLLAGGLLVTVSAATSGSPGLGDLLSRWAGAAGADFLDAPSALRAVGSLLVAFGCARWAGSLAGTSGDAEERSAALEDDTEELREKIKALRQQLQTATTTDALTDVLNRRTFIERLDETIQRDTRLRQPFAFLLIQIANFQHLNDRQGRLEGNDVLERVSETLRSATRGTDVVGRLGNDEFGVVLPECADAQPAITRILLGVQDGQGASDDEARPAAVIHVASVEVPTAAWCLGFGQLYKLGEDRLRSLRNIRDSHMARVTLQRPEVDGVA